MASKKAMVSTVLTDPSSLPAWVDDELVRVVIETPQGSRNKYAFNERDRVFELKKVLPAGMEFPYDFGFVPSTKAGDGDPVDVLVLLDEAAFTACVVTCRIIGIIQGEQGSKKKRSGTTAWLRWNRTITVGPISGTSMISASNSSKSSRSSL